MALSAKEQEFYAQLENTFMTPGWGLIVQGWKEERDGLPEAAFFNAKTPEDLRAYRVRYGLLDELIGLPDTLAQQKLNAINEEEDE